ncbi:MAG: hypothetical protein ACRD43_14060, partial [Pyrinomonadaceae bacterium]
MNRTILLVITASIFALGSACWSANRPDRSANYGRIDPASSPSSSPGTATSNNRNDNMANKNSSDIKSGGFMANLPTGFNTPSDAVGNRLMKEYGSVFVARGGTIPPSTVVFRDDNAVSTFQAGLSRASEKVGGVSIDLQAPAMKALKEAAADATQNGVSITPRGPDAARRAYADTVDLWKSRVDPALAHYQSVGKITAAEVQRIKGLSPYDQVSEVFKLESQGMYFSKDLSKPIIYSVAPPGASQHLSMLALDVSEYDNPKVREIMAKHGWYQTVVSDLPHFTYLGISESDLTKLGRKKVTDGGR